MCSGISRLQVHVVEKVKAQKECIYRHPDAPIDKVVLIFPSILPIYPTFRYACMKPRINDVTAI